MKRACALEQGFLLGPGIGGPEVRYGSEFVISGKMEGLDLGGAKLRGLCGSTSTEGNWGHMGRGIPGQRMAFVMVH